MVQLKDVLINYPNLENDRSYTDRTPSKIDITAPIYIGVSVACILIILFFICFAYYTPWRCVYQIFCHHCLNVCTVCNCIYWFYVCPCMNVRAKNCQKKNLKNCDRMYIQDFLTTADGRIIQLSNLRSANRENLNKSLNSINMV